MVQRGRFKREVKILPMPRDRLEKAEHLLGKERVDWHLVNVSSLATPRKDAAWKCRLERLNDLPPHAFLKFLRSIGFRTRSGHGGRFVQEIATRSFVHLW
jgi:hypothetical protein